MRIQLSLLTVFISSSVCGSVLVKLDEFVTVKGKQITSGNHKVSQFTGIPYAQRQTFFEEPKGIKYPSSSKFEIDATTPGAVCPQVGGFVVPEGVRDLLEVLSSNGEAVEDGLKCQSLDIYAPVNGKANKRVVVYIHGGGMDSGSRYQALNRPDKVHRLDGFGDKTIWVNVGYSLGPLGFWHMKDKDGKVHTNTALLEIVEALKWIQTFISKFSGNPKDVTLMGHSAGAALVQTIHFMLHEPTKFGFAEGSQPFQKIIMMSGTSYLFSPVSVEEAKERQLAVVEKTSCKGKKGHQLNRCLQSLSDSEIIEAARKAKKIWGPILDGDIIKGEPDFHLEKGLFLSGVSVMFTITSEDCGLFCIRHKDDIIERGHGFWETLGHSELVPGFEKSYAHSNYEQCNFKAAVKAATDAMFAHPALRSSQFYTDYGLKVVHHQFKFSLEKLSWKIVQNLAWLITSATNVDAQGVIRIIQELGTFHGEDQALLFNAPLKKNNSLNIENLSSQSQVHKILAPLFEFIADGQTTNVQPIEEAQAPADQVNVDCVVKMLYTGELPTDFTAKEDDKDGEEGEEEEEEEEQENHNKSSAKVKKSETSHRHQTTTKKGKETHTEGKAPLKAKRPAGEKPERRTTTTTTTSTSTNTDDASKTKAKKPTTPTTPRKQQK